MSNTSHSASAARYANALFQLAKEAKVLDSISSDLEKIIKFLLSDSDIASFIENPSVKNINNQQVEVEFRLWDVVAQTDLIGLRLIVDSKAWRRGRVRDILYVSDDDIIDYKFADKALAQLDHHYYH